MVGGWWVVRKVIIVSVHVLYIILRLFTSDRRSCKVLKFTSVTSVYIGLRWWTGTWSSTILSLILPAYNSNACQELNLDCIECP